MASLSVQGLECQAVSRATHERWMTVGPRVGPSSNQQRSSIAIRAANRQRDADEGPRFAALDRAASPQGRGAAVARTARSLFAEAVLWRFAVHLASHVPRNPTPTGRPHEEPLSAQSDARRGRASDQPREPTAAAAAPPRHVDRLTRNPAARFAAGATAGLLGGLIAWAVLSSGCHC